ncbi:MAG: DUF433 domain-containing protein [Nitrospira sp.]|nr:DUF433 domain-containing protein [Nitrospira sp.]
MTEKTLLKRIVINPKIMLGKPVIKGTRLTVEIIMLRKNHLCTICKNHLWTIDVPTCNVNWENVTFCHSPA